MDRHLKFFYSGFRDCPQDAFVDFDIAVMPGKGLRRWWKPQARFLLDGNESFFPLPADQAAPLLEWGINWCIASRAMGYLVMHAAVVARDGHALVMPGFPGAGKSTLCASLCLLGAWRLLSDELAILDPGQGVLLPHPRPISLKNNSLAVVRGFPDAQLGPVYRDTRKGDISHAASPLSSVQAAHETAKVRWIVLPRFEAGAPPQCEEISRVEAFVLISEQSFNKERMGETGFNAMCAMLTDARCFQITYGSTEAGLTLIEQIART